MVISGQELTFASCDFDCHQYDAVANDLEVLTKIAQIMLTSLESNRVRGIQVSEAFEIAEILHDLLIPLNEKIPGAHTLKTVTARICETWWIQQNEGAENLVPQLIPYLSVSALNSNSRESDVRRLYHIRGALL